MSTLATLPHTLTELDKEARMGGLGSETQTREIRRIDLSDFDARRAQIADELWAAATDVGFFQLVNHGIDLTQVQGAFDMAQRFFALPDGVKSIGTACEAVEEGDVHRAASGASHVSRSLRSTAAFSRDQSAASPCGGTKAQQKTAAHRKFRRRLLRTRKSLCMYIAVLPCLVCKTLVQHRK